MTPAPPAAPTGAVRGPAAPPPRRRWRRRLVRAAAGTAVVLVVAGAAFSAWVEHACVFEPPALPAGHPAMAWRGVDAGGGVRRCGPAWLRTDDGILELSVEGDAVARGRATAELCGEVLGEQEREMRVQLDRALPPGVFRGLLRKGTLFAYRDLPRYVGRDCEVALAAMLPTCETLPASAMADLAPTYHRIVFYQSLYDTSQAMAEAGLVDGGVGCTTVAASGAATADGGLLVARNCDFEGGAVFDRRKVVHFVAPDRGQRHVAVSWAGMLGALSGVNESGLVVMLHATRTARTRWPRVGRPVPLVLADALLHDRTIEDVAARLRASPCSAAALVVVAETATGRAAVVESDPDRTVVVRAEDDVLVAANHARDAVWDGDPVVERSRRAGSSALRHARAAELAEAARGRLDVVAAAAILRDRRGVGGREIGAGNRTAISALIAAHAVVWDGARRRLHVARAPRGLGEFVAYDVGPFLAGAPAAPDRIRAASEVPADADPGVADRVERGRALVAASEAARDAGDAAAALRAADEAVRLMDRAPTALLARAEALLLLGRDADARAAAAGALDRQPVPGVEEDRLRAIVRVR